jgi:hypothetical protein
MIEFQESVFRKNEKHSKKYFILKRTSNSLKSVDRVLGTATGYVLYDTGVRVRVPVESRIFSFLRPQPASYPMITGGSVPGNKEAGA